MSGKPLRSADAIALMPSRPAGIPGGGVPCSTKSVAQISSTTASRPCSNTSTGIRREIALFCSTDMCCSPCPASHGESKLIEVRLEGTRLRLDPEDGRGVSAPTRLTSFIPIPGEAHPFRVMLIQTGSGGPLDRAFRDLLGHLVLEVHSQHQAGLRFKRGQHAEEQADDRIEA